jgi:hypothetical protein
VDALLDKLLGRDSGPDERLRVTLALGISDGDVVEIGDDGFVELETPANEIARRVALAVEARKCGEDVLEAIEGRACMNRREGAEMKSIRELLMDLTEIAPGPFRESRWRPGGNWSLAEWEATDPVDPTNVLRVTYTQTAVPSLARAAITCVLPKGTHALELLANLGKRRGASQRSFDPGLPGKAGVRLVLEW